MGQFKNKDITSGRRSAFEWIELQNERDRKKEEKRKSTHVPSEAQLAARFQPGVSGNSNGKPLGAVNKITLVKEAIAKGEGLSPGEMMMEIAARNFGKDSTAGDALALKAIIEANKYVEPSADTQAVIEASSVDDMTDEELDKEILTLVGNN
jgi:hypothetical protein